jgi:sugar/nucleoside kinase (ribokinase family)
MEKSSLVVGLCVPAIDKVIQCNYLPKEDGFSRLMSEKLMPGGSGANVLTTITVLGGEAKMITKIGDDEFGKLFRKGLREDGVSDEFVFTKPGGTTLYNYVFVDTQGNKSIIGNLGDALFDLKASEMKEEMLSGAAVFYTDAMPAVPAIKLARFAKKINIPVFLQIECVPSFLDDGGFCCTEDLEALLQLSDLICAGRDVYEEMTKCNGDFLVALSDISLKYRPKHGVICTAGSKGAYWLIDSQILHAPPYPIKAIDTTGAGDTFCGALMQAYFLKRKTPKDALSFACACAALKCMTYGPRFVSAVSEVNALCTKTPIQVEEL